MSGQNTNAGQENSKLKSNKIYQKLRNRKDRAPKSSDAYFEAIKISLEDAKLSANSMNYVT